MKIQVDVHREPQEEALPLTSENLKKFDKQFQRRSGNFYSRRKLPERTAADGRSAKNSVTSAIENEISSVNPVKTVEARTYEHRRSLFRPIRDVVRKNPEGRSKTGSASTLFANATKIYYDDFDNYIPYEDPNHVIISWSRATNEFLQEKYQHESSSFSSSIVTKVTKPKKIRRHIPSDESVLSSTSASSSDIDLSFGLDYDDDDTTSEEQTTTIKKSTPSTGYTRSSDTYTLSSSSNIASSQISSPSETQELEDAQNHKTKTTEDEIQKNKEDPKAISKLKEDSNVSKFSNEVAPPLIDFRARTKQSLISDISPTLNSFVINQDENTSRKDSITTASSSRESYITVRNWDRFGAQSKGGYSITDKIMPFNRRNNSSQSISSSSIYCSQSESDSSASSFGTLGSFKRTSHHTSEPQRPTGQREGEYESSSVETSSEGSSEETTTEEERSNSSSINKSQIRNKKADAKKNLRSAAVSSTQTIAIEIGKTKERYHVTYRLKQTRMREKDNDVDGVDFKHRTKKVLKLRDRPPRPKGGLGKSIPRKEQGGKAENRESSLDQDEAMSTFTSTSYTPPLHRRPKRTKSSFTSNIDRSSVSRSSSAVSHDSFQGRLRKHILKPLNINDSGFVTDGSERPMDTPFTHSRNISGLSLRSIVLSDDSGCSSCYRESDSNISRSSSSCTSSSGIDAQCKNKKENKGIKCSNPI